jgi:hypothetical protein
MTTAKLKTLTDAQKQEQVAKATAYLTNPVPQRTIVALSERFVFMGDYTPATDTTPAFLTNAMNIRAWGTTAGLGEIALKGPTPSTELDDCGIVVIPNGTAILFTLVCSF